MLITRPIGRTVNLPAAPFPTNLIKPFLNGLLRGGIHTATRPTSILETLSRYPPGSDWFRNHHPLHDALTRTERSSRRRATALKQNAGASRAKHPSGDAAILSNHDPDYQTREATQHRNHCEDGHAALRSPHTMFHQTLIQYATMPNRAAVREVATQARHWTTNQALNKHNIAKRAIRTKTNEAQNFHDPDAGITIKAMTYDNQTGFTLWFYTVREQPPGQPLPSMQAILMVQQYNGVQLPYNPAAGSFTGLIEVREPYTEEHTQRIVSDIKTFLGNNAAPSPEIVPDSTGERIYSIADLLTNRTVILAAPWQADRQPLPDAVATAQHFSETIDLAVVDHATHRAITRELTASEDILTWAQSDLIMLYRPDNIASDDIAMLSIPTNQPEAEEVIYRYIRNMKESMNFYVAQEMMQLTMGLSISHADLITTNSIQPVPSETAEHRIQTLTDRVQQLQKESHELRIQVSEANSERDLLLEQNPHAPYIHGDAATAPTHQAQQPEATLEPDDVPETLADAIARKAHDWPNITIMDSFFETLPEYSDVDEDRDEFINAIETIHKIASALANTPSRKIGSWAAFFSQFPKWRYHDKESAPTLARHGDLRDFRHQQSVYRISRNISREDPETPVQIFFDIDHTDDRQIMLAYLGPQLPHYAQSS